MFRLTTHAPIRKPNRSTSKSIPQARIRNQLPTTNLPPQSNNAPTTSRPTNNPFTILLIKQPQRSRISTLQPTISSKRTSHTQTRNLQFHQSRKHNRNRNRRTNSRSNRRQLSKHTERSFHVIPNLNHNRVRPTINSRRKANKSRPPINRMRHHRQPNINQTTNQTTSPRRMYKTTLI